jgi:hypothetical protein
MHVYVAGPYTTGNPNSNTKRAIEVAERVKEWGMTPFVPHLYHFWDFLQEHDYEYWMDLCLAWLPKCDAVLRISGASPGANREVELATSLGIPVFHELEELIKYKESHHGTSTSGRRVQE